MVSDFRAGSRFPPAALWLAGALLLLPWTYRMPWDTPRTAALLLLAPAVALGHAGISLALRRIFGAGRITTWLAVLLLGAAICSTVLSPHWAASAVTAATWCLLALAAVLAGQLIATTPAVSTLLAGALAASSALAIAIHGARWLAGEPPSSAFYLHHRMMGLHTFSGALASLALILRTWRAPVSRLYTTSEVVGRSGRRPCLPTAPGGQGRPSLLMKPCVVWFGVGLVNWAGLLWTGSRSPLVGLAAALALWLFKLNTPGRWRLALATACLTAGGLALSRAAWTPEPYLGWWNMWARTAITTSASTITSHRSDFWVEAFQHVRASPWFGYGADAWGFLQPQLEGAQPHNLVLQLLLDIGSVGTAAALALLTRLFVGLPLVGMPSRLSRAPPGRRARSPTCPEGGSQTPPYPPPSSAPPVEPDSFWPAFAAGCVVASFLDGYFYYLLAAFPAMIALGASAAPLLARNTASVSPSPLVRVAPAAMIASRGWPAVAAAAAGLLLLHSALFHLTARRPTPDSPAAFTAQLWRAFPSTTFNVDEWVNAWAARFPGEALRDARHALPHAQTPELFRVPIAHTLARRGEFDAALAELERARADSRPSQHPALDAMLGNMRRQR